MTDHTAHPLKIKGKDQKSSKEKRKEPRPPKKITERYLHNSGLYYLERFAASKAHFKTTMMRKIQKSCYHHKDQDINACEEMLDALIEKFESSELLNDDLYTRGTVTSLRRRGLSQKAIVAKLRAKGIASDLTLKHLNDVDEETSNSTGEADLKAAILLCRKKRIGAFGIHDYDGEDGQKLRKRHLGALARAGYSYGVSVKVLDMPLEDAEEFLMGVY